jgi:hypothetical protein
MAAAEMDCLSCILKTPRAEGFWLAAMGRNRPEHSLPPSHRELDREFVLKLPALAAEFAVLFDQIAQQALISKDQLLRGDANLACGESYQLLSKRRQGTERL